MKWRNLAILATLFVVAAEEAQAQYVMVPGVPVGNYRVRVRPNGTVQVRGRGVAVPLVDSAIVPTTSVVTTTPVVTTTTPVVTTTRVVGETRYLVPATTVVSETRVVRSLPVVTSVPVMTSVVRPLFPRSYLVPAVPVYGARTVVYPTPW